MTLSPGEREEIAETLLESIDGTARSTDIDAAWQQEVSRRIDEARRGEVTMLTRDEVNALIAEDRAARGM